MSSRTFRTLWTTQNWYSPLNTSSVLFIRFHDAFKPFQTYQIIPELIGRVPLLDRLWFTPRRDSERSLNPYLDITDCAKLLIRERILLGTLFHSAVPLTPRPAPPGRPFRCWNGWTAELQPESIDCFVIETFLMNNSWNQNSTGSHEAISNPCSCYWADPESLWLTYDSEYILFW